jgi:hypothetical protein
MTPLNDLRRSYSSFLAQEAARDRDRWILRMKIAGIVAFILSAFALVGAIDMRAEEATSAQVHEHMQRLAAARELERGLRGCPPAGPGMTDVVVMVVRYESDIVPVVEHCMRFTERSYLPRPRNSSSLSRGDR